jgi:pimeloyl-ACP methyl ester carboxylesterase
MKNPLRSTIEMSNDPLAILEEEGSAFQAVVAEEDALWAAAISNKPVTAWKTAMDLYQKAAWPETREYAHTVYTWQGHKVAIQKAAAGYTFNVWIGQRTWKALSGFGTCGTRFYTLEDVGKGAECLELRVWNCIKEPKCIWKHVPVGPSVVLTESHVYFQSVENFLRYPDVRCLSLATFKTNVIFTEKNPRFQVSILERSGSIYIHSANALDQTLWRLEKNKPRLLGSHHSTLIPLYGHVYASDREVWNAAHKTPQRIGNLPPKHFWIDGIQVKEGILAVLGHEGMAIVGVWSTGTWRECWSSEELSDVQILHEPTEFPTLLIRRPSKSDEVWEYREGELRIRLRYPEPLRLRVIAVGSTKGVPYEIVAAVRSPTKLLVEGYGAYGISAKRAYPVRWLSYLAKGYAYAVVCPRGGRDKGDVWYDGGRTAARKHHTFEDTATAIQAIQDRLGIPGKRTVFFGRSAGGWLAAQMAQAYPELVAAVYAEVPYVDVLRTTSNPSLPLTQLEYDEFGDPVHRPAEKKALLRISPVDTVPPYHPGLHPGLVIRTALHDKQVLPYESLKWARRLRAAGWVGVHVGIDHDGGHFAAAKSMVQQRAEDAALLDGFVQRTLHIASAEKRRKTLRRGSVGTAGRGTRRRSTKA